MNQTEKNHVQDRKLIFALLFGFGVNIAVGLAIIYFFPTEFSWKTSFTLHTEAFVYGLLTGLVALLVVFVWKKVGRVKLPANKYTSELMKIVQKPWGPPFIALGAGISEELLFRGALFGLFNHIFGTVIAVLLVSILFTMLHIPQYKEVPMLNVYMFFMSILLTIAYVFTKSLWAPIIAHALYNYVVSRWLKSGFLTYEGD